MATVQAPVAVQASRLPSELLERAGVHGESVVMLESTPRGALVRKLTPTEKNEYQRQTGESVIFMSADEFDEALMALPYEADGDAE